MKRNSNRSTRRVALTVSIVLALAALLGAMLGIGGFATETVKLPDVSATANDEGGSYLDIYAANVDYEEYLHIWYAVSYDFGELELDAEDVKMAFWYAPQSAYTKYNAAYTATGAQKLSVTPAGGEAAEVVILHSDDIPAAHMVDTLYARAYIENGDEVYYSEVLKYSVVQYVQDRFLDAEADSSSVTNAQMTLYRQTLEYGANAQKVLGYKTDRLANAAYVYLQLDNGAFSDGTSKALLLPGESVEAYAAANGTFVAWYDQNGEQISTDKGYKYVAGETEENVRDTIFATHVGDAIPGATLGVNAATATTLGAGDSPVYVPSSHASKYSVVYVDVKGDGEIVKAVNSKKYASTGHGMTVKSLNSKSESSVGMVYEFDIQVNGVSKETANLMEWDIGTDHRTYLNINEGKLAFAHFHKTGDTTGINAKFNATFEVGEWINIRTEYHFGELPNVTKDGYPDYAEGTDAEDYFYAITYVNGDPIGISSYHYHYLAEKIQGGSDTLRVYSYGSSGADYEYTIANVKFSYVDEVATVSEALAENPDIRCKTLATIYEQWLDTEEFIRQYAGITEEGVEEFMEVLRDFTDLYSYEEHEVWRWIANLYDPETGGFYYSNSARDTYGYLPDLETSGQIHAVLKNLGVINSDSEALPTDEAKAKLASWIMSLQSNQDGFFYHPQWGTDVSTSRRSRDYGKLSYIKTYLGESTILFDNVAERANGNGIEGIATVVPYKAAEAQGVAYEIPTVTLQRDVAAMVAKVLVTSTPTGLTGHLASTQTFVKYLEDLAKARGLTVNYAERTVEHNNGNFDSYSFGHVISSQSGQIGLNKDLILVCIDFMNLIQDSMMEYQTEKGLTVTGLWTEKLHYNAINGLLKTSGAYNSLANNYKSILEAEKEAALAADPNADVSEFEYKGECRIRYADKAFDAALVALMKDADATGDWTMDNVVDVYNPPNGALNLISSLEKHYGDDNAELAEAMLAEIKEKLADKDTALTIVTETYKKVQKFLKVDAEGNYSFSYGANYSAGNSQGEAAAVPDSAEGDVNGTSLAISSRVNVLSLLGIPYVDIATTAYKEDYYAIINSKTEAAEKKSYYADADADTTITFDKDADAPKPSNSSVTATIVDGTLKFNESNTNGGGGITFSAINKFSADGKIKYLVSGDFKFTKNKVGTQIFLHNGAGSNIVRIDVSSTNNGDTLVLKYHYYSDGASGDNPNKNFEVARVDADKWFNIAIEMYPELYDGANATAATAFLKVTVKQEGKADQVKDIAQAFKNTTDLTSFSELYLYGLKTSVTECYIDNLVCECYSGSDDDGVYYFDGAYVPNGGGNEVVAEPGKSNGNKVLKVQSIEYLSAITLDANKDNAYTDQIHYNYLEAKVIAETYKAGDRINLVMTNTTGEGQIPIVGVTAKVNENGTISFYGPNDQALIENLVVAKAMGDKFVMTVKIYYYRDSNRMDLVVRYNDMSVDAATYPNGKATAVGAVMTDVVTTGNSAEYSMAVVSVTQGTVIYIDDIFARNYAE